MECVNCSRTLDPGAAFCPYCGARQASAVAPGEVPVGGAAVPAGSAGPDPSSPPPTAPKGGGAPSLVQRYRDAYRVMGTVEGFGSFLKVVGVLVGVLAVWGASNGIESSGGGMGVLIGLGGGFVGVLAGGFLFVGGVLVSAAAQILKATVDTAVNTSPLLSDVQRLESMGLGS